MKKRAMMALLVSVAAEAQSDESRERVLVGTWVVAFDGGASHQLRLDARRTGVDLETWPCLWRVDDQVLTVVTMNWRETIRLMEVDDSHLAITREVTNDATPRLSTMTRVK